MLPSSVDRVPRHTAPEINRRIRNETVRNIAKFRGAPPQAIQGRLAELAREWDIERAIEANAASIGLAGIALGTLVDRRFLLLPAAVTAFLLQHAVQGWCPPIPILRRLGYRTRTEIDAERLTLSRMMRA